MNPIKPEDDQKLIDAGINEFHRLYNEQKFEEIADTLYDPFVLQATGKNEFVKGLEHLYRRCGKVINVESSSQPTTYFNRSTGNRERVVVLKTNFEKGANYQEVLVFFINTRFSLALIKISDSAGFLVQYN